MIKQPLTVNDFYLLVEALFIAFLIFQH